MVERKPEASNCLFFFTLSTFFLQTKVRNTQTPWQLIRLDHFHNFYIIWWSLSSFWWLGSPAACWRCPWGRKPPLQLFHSPQKPPVQSTWEKPIFGTYCMFTKYRCFNASKCTPHLEFLTMMLCCFSFQSVIHIPIWGDGVNWCSWCPSILRPYHITPINWCKLVLSPYHPHPEEKAKVETYLVKLLLPASFLACQWLILPAKFRGHDICKEAGLPVFEDAVGDVDAHDGVDDEKDQDGEVEPDELVQLAVEEAGP